MQEIGTMSGYSIGPDKVVGGGHVCRITLLIKTGPVGLPIIAQACGELLGEQVAITLQAVQEKINGVTGEAK
jgi:hypothetical protein